ncbi:MAG: IgA Peptidase M64, partial [Muribaculaceae bacterium]|nr:IgA Peptidase M64 [Muribaculaceae bacterium]
MNPLKKGLVTLSLSVIALTGYAKVEFDKTFNDSTLRLDYIFSGNANNQYVSLQAMHASDGWYGRRHNLDRIPLLGNGQLTMTDVTSGDTIYRTSFSDLFLEWLETDEAQTTTRAMQATQNVPMPKQKANVIVTLFNHRNEPTTTLSHVVDPKDILIKRHKPTNITPHRYIHQAGSPKEKIDVAILAEGYTEAEMDSFYVHAQKAVASILSHSPFKDMADRFNFVAVASPSKDSG